MKKSFLIGVFLTVFAWGRVEAQSLADDITQLTLDTEKLTQLKSILSDMYKAYTIIFKGYEEVKSLSQGNFSLHKVFLDGLMAVSPVVQQYAKIDDIINKEAALIKEYKAANTYFHNSGHFTDAELDFMSNLYTSLFNASVKNVDELVMVITAGQLRMSDAQRLAAIDRIDHDITDKLTFLRSFDSNNSIQDLQRGRDNNDVNSMRSLYGIGN
ncbi:MAG TPA: hypothetical protein VMH27_11605 [Puia sp.]|nr:hypothetical protein [Puia sp.]